MILTLFAAPLAFDVMTRRLPAALPSLTIVAVTPTFAALIASRMPDSEFWPGAIVTVFAPLPLDANATPSNVPKSNVSVPEPTASVVFAKPPDASFCACARFVTSTE